MLNNNNKMILLCFLLLLNTGCFRFISKPGNNQIRINTLASGIVTHHQVKSGETLYSIAFEYGRDYRDVARWNGINRSYTIFPKQKLRIIPIADDEKISTNRPSRGRQSAVNSRKLKSDKTARAANTQQTWRWPTKGKVISTFSYRDPDRRGIDIIGTKGQPVYAAATGRVVYYGNGLRGYGNLIILKHNDTYFSAYAHTDSVAVKENEKVKLGQKIADMGNTGTDKTKLHFEIRRNGKPVNPLKYLPKRH